jgi:hypothetical protein
MVVSKVEPQTHGPEQYRRARTAFLFVPAQFGFGERSGAENLMNLPFEEIESAKACFCVRIACGDAFGFFFGAGADDVHSKLPICRGAGKKYPPGVVLLFHPDEVLVETHRPLSARPDRSALNEIPHISPPAGTFAEWILRKSPAAGKNEYREKDLRQTWKLQKLRAIITGREILCGKH